MIKNIEKCPYCDSRDLIYLDEYVAECDDCGEEIEWDHYD